MDIWILLLLPAIPAALIYAFCRFSAQRGKTVDEMVTHLSGPHEPS